MKKLIFLFLLLSLPAYAAPPSRQNTYSSGETISSADVTGNEDSIFNYLQSGVDIIADGAVDNDAVNGSANIQCSKLNIQACSQNISTSGTIKSTNTSTIGWSVVEGANTACTTTCTNACVFGFDDGTTTIVDCTSGLADKCLCAGAL